MILSFFRKAPEPNPGRTLSLIGHQQHRDRVKARAQQIRREIGLAPSPALHIADCLGDD